MAQNFSEIANFLWAVADLLRGDYKQADYGKIIMPFALLRRLDCVLESTKEEVLAEYAKRKDQGVQLDLFLQRKSKQSFYNISKFTLQSLLDDPKHIRQNLTAYVSDFSADARDVFERFKFSERLTELDDKDLLFMLVQKFAAIDLHPDVVPNETMGYAFEELIRRFAETSNETAGEHFTPREVIKLMVHILFAGDDEALSKSGIVRSMYDPTAGTGGMLSTGEHTMGQMNPSARLRMFGQELNDESYAICKADMLIKGQDPARIKSGNTLSNDHFANEKFDYMLSNPPFGVEWKKVQDVIKAEHEKKGFAGRFGPGLPRISDGSLLFLMHLVSKMRPASEGGSRIGIVLNGSPLFTGDAGSGESEIRRWLLENDMLETIIALPNDLFYNTGIATYIWILDNTKTGDRKGKVQLIDATRMYGKMQKSLGSKRVEITNDQIDEIVSAYSEFKRNIPFELEFREGFKKGAPVEDEPARIACKVFPTTFFGYRKVTIDRPPADSKLVKVKKGQKPYDPGLRDTESIPLSEPIASYFEREVKPHVPDAWVNTDVIDEKDGSVGKVGYEINFNRYFYVYKAPRAPHILAEEIRQMEKRFLELMKGVIA